MGGSGDHEVLPLLFILSPGHEQSSFHLNQVGSQQRYKTHSFCYLEFSSVRK